MAQKDYSRIGAEFLIEKLFFLLHNKNRQLPEPHNV